MQEERDGLSPVPRLFKLGFSVEIFQVIIASLISEHSIEIVSEMLGGKHQQVPQ